MKLLLLSCQCLKNRTFLKIVPNHHNNRVQNLHFASIFLQKWGSTKKHRAIPVGHYLKEMADPKTEAVLAPLRALVSKQGDIVKQLKATGAPDLDVKQAVANLKLLKKDLEDKELSLVPNLVSFDRDKLEDLLKRRFSHDQSFSIQGGVAGQYDFGPIGCAFKRNLLENWLHFFVYEEDMLEVDCSILTPEAVLKASGHVDRFSDLLVKDVKTGDHFRLDHLIKEHLENIISDKKTPENIKDECKTVMIKLDGLNKDELHELLRKYDMKSESGNELSEPIDFNLMFGTQIGPSGDIKGYLRPETAQGIFVNFKRLLEYNRGRLPFAAAQIGTAFRNEISPRSGLLRVREFTMAEIEHFCDPDKKTHLKFKDVQNTELLLYSACNQMAGKSAERKTIGDAVREGLVNNETLGYFIARIQQYLIQSGVDPQRLRFRQHMGNEMAHYAQDCWDAECLTSYGWIECVGCADRSGFDLTQHTEATGVRLVAKRKLLQPRTVDIVEVVSNKGLLEGTFKKDVKCITDALATLKLNEIDGLEKSLKDKGWYELIIGSNSFNLTKEMISVQRSQKLQHTEEITPNVIEPSFGIGRIMYSIFEHNFRMRDNNEHRTYLSLPANVAPFKCSVLPLSNKAEFQPFVNKLSKDLTKVRVSHIVDDSSGSIGRRYARTDEIAIPYGITIDFDTLKEPHSVTLRERDTMSQVRIPLTELSTVVHNLSYSKIMWEEVKNKYPKFEQQQLGVNVIEQDDIVRQLKGLDLDAKQTVPEARFENKELNLVSFDLAKMKDLIERTFFYAESYSVYSGITGQYDFGPMGCALKRNLLQNWLQFFVREEKMLEVDCSILTPESVLKTSGHVDHFSDLITKDVNTGECFNWNHFTKAHLENIILDKKTPEKMRAECKNIIIMLDGLNKDELNERLRKYNVKNMNGNELSEPNEFNLMFGTQIGPSGLIKGYLRPETAQGIFVNFKRLLEFNQDRLPFAAAQIGTVFRNEITPSSGLIRVREFTMADIEHFCDPQNMAHLKFEDVRNTELLLYSASDQINGKSAEWKTIGDAVRDGLVDNETLGYFIARIQQFLIQSGVDPQRLRFRQHMGNEKAHYAQDSWDAECLTSYGWINCVGIADRSTFDLTQHAKATGVRLVAEKRLHEPRIVDVVEAVSNKVLLGKTFKKEMKIITDALADLKLNEIEVLEKSLKDKGSCELIVGNHTFKLTKEMISVKRSKKTEYTEEITPNVIGSSFGVGRIMHVIFEHNFRVRENQRSTYFSLPTSVAPRKCSILPVSDNAELQSLVNQLSNDLATVGVSRMVDCSSEPIGMRYARSDEFGIPYVITIDFDSLKQPHSVILRERDSMSQVRIPLTELSTVIHNLSHGEIIWKEVENNYPKFEQQENKRIEVHAV